MKIYLYFCITKEKIANDVNHGLLGNITNDDGLVFEILF